MRLLQEIEDAAGKIAPGRPPYFVEAHIVKALSTISQTTVGRLKLARALGLGEGTIRTLIRHLEKEGLVKISKEGIMLTEHGNKLVSSLRSKIGQPVEIPKSSLTVGAFNIAILVKDGARGVKAGIEQRDAAIKVGAQGATTLILSHGKLSMPSVNEDVFKDRPEVREKLTRQLRPTQNDVIVVGSANDRLTAEFGAIAAALETLKASKNT